MIVIFVIFLTTVFAQQEKYIQLLHDDEKHELLDSLARGVMESGEHYGTNIGSRELTDEQLKKHNSYVQSLMALETVAFEARRKKREIKSREEENKSKENHDSKENPFLFRGNDDDKLDVSGDNIGLSETAIKRRNSDEDQKTSITSNVTSVETTEPSIINNSNEEKGTTNYQSKSSLDTETQDSGSVDSITEIQNENIKSSSLITENENTTITPSTTFENNSQYDSRNETNVALPVTAKTSSQELVNVTSETTTSNIQKLEYDTARKSGDNATESNTQYSNDGTLTSLVDENVSNLVTDTATNKKSDLPTTFNSQAFTTTTQYTDEVNTATTENYSAVTENRVAKDLKQTNSETTTFLPILTTDNIGEKHSNKTPKIVTLNHGLLSYIATKALNNIKHELELKEQGKFVENEIETTNKGNLNLNYYKVYEIPWPTQGNNKPFLRSQEPTKDQPYYVPVYKYSPNFAYYNPKNRLGPNEMEENPKELETRLRDKDENIIDKEEPSEFILQLNNELRKFGIMKHKRAKTKQTRLKSRIVFRNENEEKAEEDKTKEKEEKAEEEKAEGEKAEEEKAEEEKEKEEKAEEEKAEEEKAEEEKAEEQKAEEEKAEEEKPEEKDKTKEHEENAQDSTHAPPTDEHEAKDSCESSQKDEHSTHHKKKGHTIAEILDATPEKDLFMNLEKLQAMGIPLMRSKAESNVNVYLSVLKDLIQEDSKSLKQYDWLTTTVRIQTVLMKILKLIKRLNQSKQLYPADLQLLRYMVFLHEFSLEMKEDNKLGIKLRKRLKFLPKNKKKRKSKLLKEKGLMNRVWLYLRKLKNDLNESNGLSNLYDFLIDVKDGLFDLHEAIRYIADVTKFKRQNWYSNLKQLYLSADEKHLRELLLHISMSRLVDLVEHSRKHSLDHDFIQFMKANKKDAKRIVEEMIFINDIVHEITINKR